MRVIISGGGTGGHIYPALAIINEIKKREPDSHFLYVGTPNGLEAGIVPKADIPFHPIQITGFQRKLSFENAKTIYRFLKGVRESKKIISFFKPDIVIGTGGYVCGPVVFAAARMKLPTLIHEQNVIPGLTNQFLSRYTSAIAVSFEGSAQYFQHTRLRVTGNPRATEVVQADGEAGRNSLHIPKGKKVIMIVGGSRGAKAINEAFVDMLHYLNRFPSCHFIYVTGEVHYDEVSRILREKGIDRQQVTIKPFIYNMPDVLAGTDLIVNRAGASFLAEITALGLPSILIPSPYVTNNHQEKNARWMEQEGASKVILEKELDANVLFEAISSIINQPEVLSSMSTASNQLGLPEAAESIYHLARELIQS